MREEDIREAVEYLLRAADKVRLRGQQITPTGVRLAVGHLRAVLRSVKRTEAKHTSWRLSPEYPGNVSCTVTGVVVFTLHGKDYTVEEAKENGWLVKCS